MATITSVASGNWGTAGTWDSGVPGNGDAVIIAEGHQVTFNVNQSGFADGLSGLTINGLLKYSTTTDTYLKMNADIDGTGALYVCARSTGLQSQFDLVNGYDYTYVMDNLTNLVIGVEETIGDGYKQVDSISEVEATAGSFYHNVAEGLLYVHTLSGGPLDENVALMSTIRRPSAGTEYKSYLSINSNGIITVPIVRMYGWFPDLEYTSLSADAESGQNQIVLTDDLNLQSGDIILIGSAAIDNLITTTQKGKYTVSAYDSGSKTVTLTQNLDIASSIGDAVAIASRPIQIKRTSGYSGLIQSEDAIIVGVYFNSLKGLYPPNGYASSMLKNGLIQHCTCNYALLTWGGGFRIQDCLVYGYDNSVGGVFCSSCSDCEVTDCIAINNLTSFFASSVRVDNLVIQNSTAGFSQKGSACSVSDSVFKNIAHLTDGSDTVFTNCIFSGRDGVEAGSLYKNNFINCEFEESSDGVGWLGNYFGKLHNCLINDGDISINDFERPQNIVVESFDHNQIQGQYKAWMKGGNIETDFQEETVLPGRLIFNCESADYPVFRDFPVLLPGYRTQRWQALANKSFTGGEVKLELIDPTADPLMDPTAAPLASYSLPDQAETNLPLKLGFKSDKAMMAILRISAKNASGTVAVDTRLIENRVQHGQ